MSPSLAYQDGGIHITSFSTLNANISWTRDDIEKRSMEFFLFFIRSYIKINIFYGWTFSLMTKMLVLPDSRDMYKSFGTWSVSFYALIDWKQEISQNQFSENLHSVQFYSLKPGTSFSSPLKKCITYNKIIFACKNTKTFTLIESIKWCEKNSATGPTKRMPKRTWKQHLRGDLMTEILLYNSSF